MQIVTKGFAEITMDGDQLRITLRNWPSGVTVITTQTNDARFGMTVSSFMSVSLEPPLVAVCLAKDTPTAQAILETRVFGVSILSDQQDTLSGRFAGLDPDFPYGTDYFDGLQTYTLETGAPLLSDVLANLDCRVWTINDGSTHYVILGQVVGNHITSQPPQPLVYYNRGYHKILLKADDS